MWPTSRLQIQVKSSRPYMLLHLPIYVSVCILILWSIGHSSSGEIHTVSYVLILQGGSPRFGDKHDLLFVTNNTYVWEDSVCDDILTSKLSFGQCHIADTHECLLCASLQLRLQTPTTSILHAWPYLFTVGRAGWGNQMVLQRLTSHANACTFIGPYLSGSRPACLRLTIDDRTFSYATCAMENMDILYCSSTPMLKPTLVTHTHGMVTLRLTPTSHGGNSFKQFSPTNEYDVAHTFFCTIHQEKGIVYQIANQYKPWIF